MSSLPATTPAAVFLSYAREDAESARRIADALRGFGVEVWFDQNELRGGDAWDGRIRQQVRQCAVFIPLISRATQRRSEGYFRREWKLAVERTHDMVHGVSFIMPVVIDDIIEEGAAVPEEFLRYQWTQLPAGEPTPEFIAQVRRVREAPRAGITFHPIPGRGWSAPPMRGDGRPRGSRRALVLGGLVAAVVAVAAGWGWFQRRASAEIAEKSIAVLAFDNLSADKDNEHFSDGISEELLNLLAQIPSLKVCARTSAFHFKGKQFSIPEIAAKLGVAYVVEGSVQRSAQRIKITAQLIRGGDGFHVWSQTFSTDHKDLLEAQEEIAREIAQHLKVKLALAPRSAKPLNPEAHTLVLTARHLWVQRKADSFDRADAALTRAIQLDPEFAEAHATLANVCAMRAAYRMLDGATAAETAVDTTRAESAARRAIQLDPALADAYPALGYALMILGRNAEAEAMFRKALELNPNHAVAHSWFANLRASEGRLGEALAEYERSADLDPLWKVNLGTYAAMLGFARRPRPALELTERILANETEIFLPSLATRGMAFLALGRTSEAVDAARTILQHPEARPRWYADSNAVWILGRAGQAEEAKAEAAKLLQRLPAESYLRGTALAALGRFEEALPFLERTPPRAIHRMFWEPMWDPWRGDPRFTVLMAKLGCTAEYQAARANLAKISAAPPN